MKLNENLRAGDLVNLVKKTFEIDNYASKIGDDEDIVTLCFTVDSEDPAKDLENFIEMGYDFVMDADTSPGETEDGTFKVFVEIERSRHIAKQIIEMLDGIERLTDMPDMRFRYHKEFRSQEASLENLSRAIPMDRDTYELVTKSQVMEHFTSFFKQSFVDDISVLEESITFKNCWGEPLSFNIITSGPKKTVYEQIPGPIMLESKDVSEVLFFTKTIGNYNITKIGNAYIFENSGWAVALEKK